MHLTSKTSTPVYHHDILYMLKVCNENDTPQARILNESEIKCLHFLIAMKNMQLDKKQPATPQGGSPSISGLLAWLFPEKANRQRIERNKYGSHQEADRRKADKKDKDSILATGQS